MKIIQYNVFKKETSNAGGKAKNDIQDILSEFKMSNLYQPSSNRKIRIIQQIFGILMLKRKSIVIIQYPAVILPLIKMLCWKLNKKGKVIAVIHDLDSLRYGKDKNNEMQLLNKFDYIIVHNNQMKEYLEESGVNSQLIVLWIFDYLHDASKDVQTGKDFIAFAGNLNKSTFIYNLQETALNFGVYGICDHPENLKNNISYCGCLNSNEIVYKLEGSFGLIWDGNSIFECSGLSGNYLRFNNPHKLSLYIASGKPVITWKKSAIAEFVIDYKIGFVVDSLTDIAELIDNMSTYEYDCMRKNVQDLKFKLANGYFAKRAFIKVFKELGLIESMYER